MPLLMPDDFSELQLCAWRIEMATPDPENPLIEGDMPWDRGGVGDHSSVFKDPMDDRWKAYLECTPPEEFPEKQPENQGKAWNSENAAHRRVSLLESDDGVHWTRPELDNVPFGEHKKTNLIFDIDEGTSGYSSILIDPKNSEFPYEMRVLRENWLPNWPTTTDGNGYYLYRSRDGRSWQQVGKRLLEPTGADVCFFYRVGGELTPFADNRRFGFAGKAAIWRLQMRARPGSFSSAHSCTDFQPISNTLNEENRVTDPSRDSNAVAHA